MTGDVSASSEGRVFRWVQRECVFIEAARSYMVRRSLLKPNERDMKLEPHQGIVN